MKLRISKKQKNMWRKSKKKQRLFRLWHFIMQLVMLCRHRNRNEPNNCSYTFDTQTEELQITREKKQHQSITTSQFETGVTTYVYNVDRTTRTETGKQQQTSSTIMHPSDGSLIASSPSPFRFDSSIWIVGKRGGTLVMKSKIECLGFRNQSTIYTA